MTLEEIWSQWKTDSNIDITQLEINQQDISKLHVKYLRYRGEENFKMKKLEADLRTLKRDKYEHYTEGASKETQNWHLPPRGKIVKTDAKDWYVEADEDVNKKQLEIDYQAEKVYTLDSIIRMIHNRHYLLQNIHERLKWIGGG